MSEDGDNPNTSGFFPPGFWKRVKAAPNKLLALDYDGTLAPFKKARLEAVPYPGIKDMLQSISESGGNLAIISGRPISELLIVLGDLGIQYIGSHGWEIRSADSELTTIDPAEKQKKGLEKAAEVAANTGNKDNLEIKQASLALHTRPLTGQEAREALAKIKPAWSDLTLAHDLELRPFDGGLELRAIGRTKGDSLKDLMATMAKETLTVYIGDDDTDEDAFAVLEDNGFGFKVGDLNAPSAAKGRLLDIPTVLEFLMIWSDTIKGKENL